MKFSDKEVLHAIKTSNDDKVIAFLYESILPKVKKFILKNNGSNDDANDIFQDAVLIFYKYVKTGKFKEEYEIAGFIYSISRNLWINHAKKKDKFVILPEGDDFSSTHVNASDELITREREEYIMRLFSEIGDSCKQILIYSIFDKFSMKEIKEKMGFSSEDVAKTKNYKCKQKLISMVKENPSIKDILKG